MHFLVSINEEVFLAFKLQLLSGAARIYLPPSAAAGLCACDRGNFPLQKIPSKKIRRQLESKIFTVDIGRVAH